MNEHKPQIAGSAADADVVRSEYNRLAGFYDRRWRRYIKATLSIVDQAVTCTGNERILDAPCGTGELEQRLLKRWPGLHLVGVDISDKMLTQARAKDAAGAVEWLQADVAALPLPDNSFDWVICANSFHYFRAPERALSEFRRVLRPTGRLVLVDWCDDYFMCMACGVWLRWSDPAFYKMYSMRSCRALMKQAGFFVESEQRFRVDWIWGLMRFVCRRNNLES